MSPDAWEWEPPLLEREGRKADATEMPHCPEEEEPQEYADFWEDV